MSKMGSSKIRVIVAYILGCSLLQCGVASTVNIASSIYHGDIGQVSSYNYPFQQNYSDTGTYSYRLFPNGTSKDCLTVRRFDIGTESRFSILAPTDMGQTQNFDYTGRGERVNLLDDTTLPLNIWSDFCVDLHGENSLVLTFRPDNATPVPGFHIEYSVQNMQAKAPCGTGLFTCYNRECVDDSYVCKNDAACTDKSHNTFAHAFCRDKDGSPVQQDGFWADDLDGSLSVSADVGWKLAEKVEPAYTGPSSDHTGRGKFLHTIFPPSSYDLKLTINVGILGLHKENCLSFWYYMDGRDPGQLVVTWGSTEVWERSGSYGAKWLQAQVNLLCEGPSCSTEVKITATRHSNPDTRISVDDISVMPGLCPFYEAEFCKGSWSTDDGCDNINSGLACRSLLTSSARTKSLVVSRGKCLVGEIWFSVLKNPAQTVMVFKYPVVGESEVHLKTLRQSKDQQTLPFKIPLELSVPAKIGLTLITNKDGIILEKMHVVDNECDDLSMGRCNPGQFYCAEGECISHLKMCDGVKDCSAGQDERECTKCRAGAFLCASNGHCVDSNLVCDGVDNCEDNSDEQACAPKTGTIVGIVVGVIVAVCVLVVIAIVLKDRVCKKPEPQHHATPPAYSDCVYSDRASPAASDLGHVSNPPQPQPETA